MLSSRNKNYSTEVQKLATLLPIYLQYSNFLQEKVPTDWSMLDSYHGKTKGDPFKAEYISKIPQQHSDSLYIYSYILISSFFMT